jgi:hypothetical protein
VAPSHNKYLPVSYGLVCEIIDGLAGGMASVVNEDVRSLMTHYTDMLRRNVIVGDSEIGRLCRQINQRHRRALDLLNEYSSRVQVDVQILITSLVENEAGLVRDYNSKRELYFGLGSWDTPALCRGSGGTASGRLLLFDFWNPPGSLSLTLYIGPGPKEIRRQLLDMARVHPDVFRVTGNPNSNWTGIFSRSFLNREMYEYADPVDRDKEIHKQWAEFLNVDLPKIDAALKEEKGIWESDEPDEGHSGRGERFGCGDGDIEITRRPDEPRE